MTIYPATTPAGRIEIMKKSGTSGAIHFVAIFFLLIVFGAAFLGLKSIEYYRGEISTLERKVFMMEKRVTELELHVLKLEAAQKSHP
jgi:hypothetical protein